MEDKEEIFGGYYKNSLCIIRKTSASLTIDDTITNITSLNRNLDTFTDAVRALCTVPVKMNFEEFCERRLRRLKLIHKNSHTHKKEMVGWQMSELEHCLKMYRSCRE